MLTSFPQCNFGLELLSQNLTSYILMSKLGNFKILHGGNSLNIHSVVIQLLAYQVLRNGLCHCYESPALHLAPLQASLASAHGKVAHCTLLLIVTYKMKVVKHGHTN